MLRDISRVLADTFHKLVIVVDTSEEIAGGGATPHRCIGRARRMTGTDGQIKHEVLQEAMTNHGPEVSKNYAYSDCHKYKAPAMADTECLTSHKLRLA